MSIRVHFNEASAIFSRLESQKRAEIWLQSDFFVYLPSPKKYKIQLISPFKSRKRPVAAEKASVKPIFDKKY